MVVSFCSTSDPALLKNTIVEALVHFCDNGSEHRPVVECNRHNWCSVGVTISFPRHSFVYTLYTVQFQHQITVREEAEPLTLRRLMSYIYGAPILDVSRSHTTMQHSR